jgi:hypothetical protein
MGRIRRREGWRRIKGHIIREGWERSVGEWGKNLSPSKLRRCHDSCGFGEADGKEPSEVFIFMVSEEFANLPLSDEKITERA